MHSTILSDLIQHILWISFMEHHFNIEIAKKFDVPTAIVLNHFAFWIIKNRSNNKHFHDGRYWTYNSVRAYQEIFPYWSLKQMRLVLEKVKKSGLVLTGNYNTIPYDQTTWYALSDEGLHLFNITIGPLGQIEKSKGANVIADKGKPIPDNKTYNKPYKRNGILSKDQKTNKEPKQIVQFWEPGHPDYDRVNSG